MDILDSLTAQCPTVLRDGAASYGFEISPGWHDLVASLILCLETHARINNPDLIVDQVKSKFGSLRCYVSNSDATADYIIAEAEHRSASICEHCGAPVTPTQRSRFITACNAHQIPQTQK